MNGLKMVVRFEVDAYLDPELSANPSGTKAKPDDDIDDIATALSGVRIGSVSTTKASTTIVRGMGSNLTVVHAGSLVPDSSIIELTTRSSWRGMQWNESYPQLFLSQTPHHFLAIHEGGRFVKIQKRLLNSAELENIAATSIRERFKKLRHALDVIKELVLKHGEKGRLSLVCEDSELRVYERVSQDSCLPDDILARFIA